MVQTMYTTFLWHDCQILIFSEIALWRERRLICDVSNFSGVINVDVWICDIWMCVSMYVCASVYVCACVYVCLCMCVWCTIDSHTWNRSKCIYSEARAPFLSNVYMYISKKNCVYVRVCECVHVFTCVRVETHQIRIKPQPSHTQTNEQILLSRRPEASHPRPNVLVWCVLTTLGGLSETIGSLLQKRQTKKGVSLKSPGNLT